MIKVKLGNSFSKIEGLTAPQFKELRELMSYTLDPKAQYFGGGYNTKRYLISARGDYPSGLNYIVDGFLNSDLRLGWQVNTVDTRSRPKTCVTDQITLMKPGSYPTPRLAQLEAVGKALMADRGIVSAVTGSGKSLIIGLLIDALKVQTLVVVPNLELKRQLTASLREWFGGYYEQLIEVQNVDALDPNEPSCAQMVIIDELHHVAAKTYQTLNKRCWNNAFYRFGFTATPFRTDENERLLFESFLSRVIHRISYHDAVASGTIVPVEAFYIELPKVAVKGTTYAQVYNELVVNRPDRNRIIAKLLGALHGQGVSTLCLVRELAHGRILSDLSGVSFTHGQDPERSSLIDWFNTKSLHTLIGTTGVLGEGVDSRPCEYVVVAGLGKAKGQFQQQIGRGLRTYTGKESCKVILVSDKSHKYTRDHFKEQCRTLKEEYGVVPKLLDI